MDGHINQDYIMEQDDWQSEPYDLGPLKIKN